nr:hypothetical protein [Pseudoalteromonas sp. WY3]
MSKIEVKEHPKFGASIELIDYEHRDYIEDVLCEKFDLDNAFVSNEDVTGDYVIYFGSKASIEQVKSVVAEINNHTENDREFDVV